MLCAARASMYACTLFLRKACTALLALNVVRPVRAEPDRMAAVVSGWMNGTVVAGVAEAADAELAAAAFVDAVPEGATVCC